MDKSITSQVERVLNLYHILPREPQKAYSIEELKQKIGHFYNNEIDEKSLKKNILRDLKTIELILVSGDLIEIKASGRRASSFYLSPNAYVQQFSSELALVLILQIYRLTLLKFLLLKMNLFLVTNPNFLIIF